MPNMTTLTTWSGMEWLVMAFADMIAVLRFMAR